MESSTQLPTSGWQWPVVMAFVRLPMLLAGNAIVILVYRFLGQPVGIEAGVVSLSSLGRFDRRTTFRQ